MASGLLFVLDDIASVLDDIALMTKVAARKTAGVLGDDLALNAEQVVGVRAARELPVVFAVFNGSLINKLFLVGGGILAHGIPGLEAGLHHLLAPLHHLAFVGGPLLALLPLLFHALLGILAGLLLLGSVALARRWRPTTA